MFCFSFHSFFYSKVGGGGLSKNLVVQDVLPRICCVFLMNTYDDVFGVSTKKSEQVGGGQRGSAFRFWRRRKNWRMLQGKANPIALACRDLTSFFSCCFFTQRLERHLQRLRHRLQHQMSKESNCHAEVA